MIEDYLKKREARGQECAHQHESADLCIRGQRESH